MSMLKKTALAILVALTLSAPARADFADGWAAYEAGNYDAALEHWLPLAKRGDLDALYDVAALYESGVLGHPQFDRAVAFYRQAAERRPAIRVEGAVEEPRGEVLEIAGLGAG